MTAVKDFFKIDLQILKEKFKESNSHGSYWATCLRFVDKMSHIDVKHLSQKQFEWLHKIERACQEGE